MSTIILGPEADIHIGIHGTLIDRPPSGYRYDVRCGTRVFASAAAGNDLFGRLPVAEAVDFGTGDEIVHTNRWPVLNRRAWVVDASDFGYPLMCGHFAFTTQFRERECRHETRTEEFRQDLRNRMNNMLAAYSHDSCKAVLIYTEKEYGEMGEWFRGLGLDASRLWKKVRRILPVAPPADHRVVDRKWANAGPLHIVFCGRGFTHKRGLLALRVMQRLKATLDVTCTYIGEIPAEVRKESLLDAITWHPTLTRQEVLDVFAGAHILFHPARSECVGAVIIEAAASGMAVVVAEDRGMDHIGELVDENGAFLAKASPDGSAADEAGFHDVLQDIVIHREKATNAGLSNYALVVNGRLGLRARDRILLDVYGECAANPAAEPLRMDDLPWPAPNPPFRIDSDVLEERITEYRARIGNRDTHYQIRLDL